MLCDPLEPGTHVIVARDSAGSGTTIGYHGTVVRELARSIFTHPNHPEKWYYRVHVPVLEAEIDVPATAILPTDRVERIEPANDLICEIQFDAIPSPAAADIYGAYRLRGREWMHFHFRKQDQCQDTFQLSLPTRSAKIHRGCLIYKVRRDADLDAEFVRRAIGRIVGFNASPAEDAI